jgi:hypothetical protein
MNGSQKTALALTALAIAASVIYCPYLRDGNVEYALLWDSPGWTYSIDFARLAMTWVAIAVCGLVLFAINGRSNPK